MRLLAVALLALWLAVIVGHFIAADPGFIVIGYGERVMRTSLVFFVLAVLVGLVLLYVALGFLSKLFGLRRRWRHWSSDYRRRRAHRSLGDGLLALAEGEFAKAERMFNRGIDGQARPEIHYLAAAEAAHALGASARRDNYLRLAHDLEPQSSPALDLKRAAWQIESGQPEEAAKLIATLERAHGAHPQVLKLRTELARSRGDARTVLELLPALRRDRVFGFDAANELECESACALLQAAPTSADVSAQWSSLSKTARTDSRVVTAYVRALMAASRHEEAETLLRKRLDRDWDSGLAAIYGEITCSAPLRQMRKTEAWAATRGNDTGLRLARARLALRAGLWGQARGQLEALLAVAPSPLLYRLLAEAAEGAGDTAKAAAHRRRGLDLATQEQLNLPRLN